MAEKLLHPEKRPQLTDSQDALARKVRAMRVESFSARSLGGSKGYITSLRALWKKGYVTPAHGGKISEWTVWKFTQKFFRDFPQYRAGVTGMNTHTVIVDDLQAEEKPDLAETVRRIIEGKKQ